MVPASAYILSADALLLIFFPFTRHTFMFYIWGELSSWRWIICDPEARSASSCTQDWRHGLTSTRPSVSSEHVHTCRDPGSWVTETTYFHISIFFPLRLNSVSTKSLLCYELSSMSNGAFGCRGAATMLRSRTHVKFQGDAYTA